MNSRMAALIHGPAAREGFESVVGIRNAMGAHHSLHRLAQHLPGAVQVLGHPCRVQFDFPQARRQGLET